MADEHEPNGSPGDAPFLPPSAPPSGAVPPPPDAPIVPEPALPGAPVLPASVRSVAEPAPRPADPVLPSAGAAPFLPSATPPAPAPATEPTFDAKAMVESQKHYNANPAYGQMPTGTDESRAAARKLREDANRKRRRSRTVGWVFGLVLLGVVAVAGYLAYQAFQDEQSDQREALEESATGDDVPSGALTPLGEQQQVIEALDDVNSGVTPSAGALLDAVDDARAVVDDVNGADSAAPPVPAAATILVDQVFTPAVLDHTEILDAVDGYERFYVTGPDLAVVNPGAWQALIDRLLGMEQVAEGDPRLAVLPPVLPEDVVIAIRRDGDQITEIVAVASDPVIRSVGP